MQHLSSAAGVDDPLKQPGYLQLQKRLHLTNEERLDIISRLKKNESGARIARDYGITKQAVSAIKRRAQLMGDSFHNAAKYYLPGIGNGGAVMGASGQQQQQSVGSRNGSPSPAGSPLVLYANRPPKSVKAGATSAVSINLTGSSSSSLFDNSLVSRQLKQQKMNASIIKQSNLLAQLPRSTSDLVLPVNPVAIIRRDRKSVV